MKKGNTLYLLLLIVFVSSCIKREFDSPPDKLGFDPALNVTHTIAQLKQLPLYVEIEEDIVVAGIVVMDDKSGNYFRKIVIQDSSGGIELLIDVNYLHHDYPVGRKVYVQCHGLYLGTSADNPQLGYSPDLSGFLTGIPALLADQFVVKASFPHQVVPDTITLTELEDVKLMERYYNTLVAIKEVEFDSLSIGASYAAPATIASVTQHKLKDCIERFLMLKTSAYAAFRAALIPAGNGCITGIYTRYYNQGQLSIRDTSDVYFYAPRCSEVVQTLLFQDFSSLPDGVAIALEGWHNVAEEGGKKFWKETALSGETFARITAFGGGTPQVVRSWLITPQVDLSSKWNARLSYKIRDGYDNGAVIGIYVSENYNGSSNPELATWKALDVAVSRGSTTGYAPQWTIVYTDLPYRKPVHIAFHYQGGTGKTTTFDIADVKVISE